MGRRGTRPRPTAVKRLAAGTGRSRKRFEKELKKAKTPQPPVAIPGVPDSVRFDEVAAECWKKLAKHLKEMKVISKHDGIALEGMALAYSRAMAAEKHLREHGSLLYSAFSGWKANPAAAMARQEWMEVRRFAIEFGLTPSSRTRVSEIPDDTATPAKDGKETAETFLFKGAKHGRVVGAIGA